MRSNPNRLINEFFEMQKELDRLFDTFMKPDENVATERTYWRPPMDVYETVDNFVIKIEVSGIKPDEDIKVQLDQNILTVRGYRRDRTELKKEHYHQAELNYGPFERTVALPNVLAEDVDPQASYENGFLEIHVPKANLDSPREIAVQVKEVLEIEQPIDEKRKELDDGNPNER